MKFANKRMANVAVCIIAILFVTRFVPFCFAVTSSEAAEVLARAEVDVGSAFVAVAEAEDAGANVSVLVDKLDVAGNFLSQAQLALRVDDYESAFSYASASSVAVVGVSDEAASLQLDSEKMRSTQLIFAVIGSVVDLVLLCVLGFFGWRLLKKWYFRRILDMKPALEGD